MELTDLRFINYTIIIAILIYRVNFNIEKILILSLYISYLLVIWNIDYAVTKCGIKMGMCIYENIEYNKNISVN